MSARSSKTPICILQTYYERERCPSPGPTPRKPQVEEEDQPSQTQPVAVAANTNASQASEAQNQELRGRLQVKPGLNAAPPPPPPPPPIEVHHNKSNGVRPTSPSPDYTPSQSPASKMRVYLNPPPVPPKKATPLKPKATEAPKKPGSVVLSIGAYPNSNSRPNPNRFEFLHPSTSPKPMKRLDVNRLSSDLQSELAQTLSRSNLRQKAISVDSLIRAEEDEGKNLRNGTNHNGNQGSSLHNGTHNHNGNPGSSIHGSQNHNGIQKDGVEEASKKEEEQPSVRSLSAKYSALLSNVGRGPHPSVATSALPR